MAYHFCRLCRVELRPFILFLWLIVGPFGVSGVSFSQDRSILPSNLGELYQQVYLKHGMNDSLTIELPLKCGFGVAPFLWNLRNANQNMLNLSLLVSFPMQCWYISPSGHFRIFYDTTGADAPSLLDSDRNGIPDYVDTTARIFDYVWSVEVESLGYKAPPSSQASSPYYDVYIRNLGGVIYGQTLFSDSIRGNVPNPTYRSYIEVDNNYSVEEGYHTVGIAALEVTAAHEFHHAVQVGGYGFWENDVYFYELTSTWMENVVYPEVKDYMNYLPGFFQRPDLPFTATNGIAEYGRGIFGKFLEKRFGFDIMLRAWDNIATMRPLKALDKSLCSVGTNFVREMGEFWVWNYYTGYRARPHQYYSEASSFPLVHFETIQEFVPPSGTLRGIGKPLSAHFQKTFSGPDTAAIIVCNVNMSSALTDQYGEELFELALHASGGSSGLQDLSVDLRASNRSWWWSGSFVDNIPRFAKVSSPYPNPFRPDGIQTVLIPVPNTWNEDVELTILSERFERVFQRTMKPLLYTERYAASWDGRGNDGELVASGIYWYIVECAGEIVRGKIAVVR